MRLLIRHEIRHRFDPPPKSIIQMLRLTPRSHEGQHVAQWRIDVDVECRLKPSQDAFGNIVHAFTADGRFDAIAIAAAGQIETFDAGGIIRGSIERFVPELYLRTTPLTEPDDMSRDLAGQAGAEKADDLDRLHRLLRAVADALPPRDAPDAQDDRSGALSDGAATERAHVFIAAARLMDIPARYASGYCLPEREGDAVAVHGWAEGFVPRLGWVGFDPSACVCPDDRYARLAVGLDSLGVAPSRGASQGGPSQETTTRIAVTRV
jgi:transglutaminase-like putative cysteine protease